MSSQFKYETYLPFSREDVFTWYTRPGALTRLHPPFAGAVEQEPEGGPVDGATSELTLNLPGLLGTSMTASADLLGSVLPFTPPTRVPWKSRHEDFRPGEAFSDVMISGPMRSWRHDREFVDEGPGTTLRETVTYEFPADNILPGLASGFAQRQFEQELRRIFDYRARQTTQELAFHQSLGGLGSQQQADDAPPQGSVPQVVAVSGASGMIGTQVCALLGGAGIEVRRLIRRTVNTQAEIKGHSSAEEIAWDPVNGLIDEDSLADVDAVIHLAGHPLADRFTDKHKQRVLDSRVQGTDLIAQALARVEHANPTGRVLISGSAIGWYGATAADRPHNHQELTEDLPAGNDFLAEVCHQWEEATAPAAQAGVRVATIRIGIVQSPAGGALERMLPLFAAGVGGPLGGEQVQSWISLDDLASLIVYALCTEDASRAINAVAPEPVGAHDYARTLGAVLRRPTAVPVPTVGPKLLLGSEGAEELVLADQQVSSHKITELGYAFRHQHLEDALHHLLGR